MKYPVDICIFGGRTIGGNGTLVLTVNFLDTYGLMWNFDLSERVRAVFDTAGRDLCADCPC
jgi:hypothetical protein